jgi:hypothetical protein
MNNENTGKDCKTNSVSSRLTDLFNRFLSAVTTLHEWEEALPLTEDKELRSVMRGIIHDANEAAYIARRNLRFAARNKSNIVEVYMSDVLKSVSTLTDFILIQCGKLKYLSNNGTVNEFHDV